MKLSIITVNYNNASGLERTIQSVISQTFQDYEFIIIDGGSTDNSVDVIHKYEQQISYWVSEHDGGIYQGMNKGLIQAKGDYVNFMNSGDCFHAEDVLDKIFSLDTAADIITGAHTGSPHPNIGPKGVTMYSLITGAVDHQASFIRRKVALRHPYDERYKIVSDWKFFIQALVLDNCTFFYTDTIVVDVDMTGVLSHCELPQVIIPESVKELGIFAFGSSRIDYLRIPLGIKSPYLRQFKDSQIGTLLHLIFPSAVTYVDLGSGNIMAGKADGAENVIRVKATKRWFKGETNMSVITEDGSFFTFNVKYAKEPDMLNIEMKDFIHDGSAVNRPNNSMDIYLKELGSESPVLVRLVMKSIWKQNERIVKHIGSKSFGIRFLLKGVYTHNGLLYFHTEIKNSSNVPFDVDYIVWKIVDKKVVKRTAIQEQVIQPLRTQNFVLNIDGNSAERTVWTMDKFTLPDDKCLVVELAEKNGGRHQQFVIENSDLVRAKLISELKVK